MNPSLSDDGSVVRAMSILDTALALKAQGRLEVVVRSSDRPTQQLSSSLVVLRLGPRDSLRKMTDDHGIAVFEAVSAGEIDIFVRRLGYGPMHGLVTVKAGCRTDAEVYLSLDFVGISPPAPTPARIVQTTCK